MASELVEVAFKGNRTGIFTNPVGINIKTGDYVVVGVERGEDAGIVIALGRVVTLKEIDVEPPQLLRLATPADLDKIEKNRDEENKAFEVPGICVG